MNRFSVAAAAAAAVVVAIAGSAYLLSSTQPRTGGPGASATPTAPASPTPGPTATLSPAPAAAALWNDWVADAPPLGLRDQGSRIQLSINWPDGRDIWVQTNYTTGTQVFTSTSVAGPEGQLRVVSQLRGDGCMEGDVGTYAWNRSTNGLFLTLTLVADQCAARATTLARTWVHSLGAVNDGGPGVLPVDNIQVSMPSGRFGLHVDGGASDLTTVDSSSPLVELLLIHAPMGVRAPCSAQDTQTTVAMQTSAAVVAYVRGLPGLTVTTANATIDGHAAVHVTGTPKAGATCTAGDMRLFAKASGGYWTLISGASMSLWVTEVSGSALIIWYHGDQVSPANEAQVIGTMRFITALPTP